MIGMLDPREGILHHNPAGGTLSYLSSYISSMSPVSTSPVAVNTSNCIVIAISDIGCRPLLVRPNGRMARNTCAPQLQKCRAKVELMP